eukprot:Blabericola_migrator_1__6351@NODE_31_length_18777_cov_137_037787_g27_i0_p3_GENE_NODE_31_length_18777_cov_137_037787_g27_i0NODE_31_length_18777_cov_137_037787_g27_i0_p3_ORF_typecomplete_len789_score187_42DEAD/PF00270_29/7_1e46DEAD/PF00270_29/5_6Helicase_C/PF00271_31/1_4e29ERCC3_RAD25_C/PF16203_5/1e10ResIII/PF04851_15/3_2e08ResIII/PF04851_15/7_3e02AAA_19/PF13245_6/1_8e03AAA_19/PF13245_6/0_11AAA_19/PF13245_6/1_4e02UTP25/PF06862_12/4_5e03UTP25/PF06862_12/0_0081SNF2_N/PF00176_23/0_034CMS1/PF14617_6/1
MVGIQFLTKAERERLRLEQEKQKEAQGLKLDKALEASRQEFFNKEARARDEEKRRKAAAAETARKLKEEQRRRREAEEARKAENGDDGNGTKPKKRKTAEESSFLDDTTLSPEEIRQKEEELEKDQIREHYLGMKKEKKKVQKPSEKFRNIFQFDWDGSEDTTRGDSNLLYHKRHEPQLLFGRGFRAGVDVREQRRNNGFYDSLARLRHEKLSQLADSEEIDESVLEYLSVTKIMKSDQQPVALRDVVEEDVVTHWSKKPLSEMRDRDWRILREDYSIFVKGGRVPNPIRSWAESNLSPPVLAAVASAGYKEPTPIQMQAIPIAMEMKDMIGIAETGSGKTAAFMLPMIEYVMRYPKLTDESAQLGPHGLVLAPSRELAIQIREETVKFAQNLEIRAVVLVGGRAPELQALDLRKGAEIIIGTPGRIKDCLEKAYTVLIQCHYVVLDEADRMIDMGFEEVVNWILDQIPSSNMKSADEQDIMVQEAQARSGEKRYRITQMFSATMPPSVERLAKKYLRQPAVISIGNPGAGKKSIEQRFEFLSEGKKKVKLEEVLADLEDSRIIVFVNQKKNADMIAKTLKRQGYGVVALHGGRSQDNRETSLDQFKNGDVNILVATDVAGRGLDVEDVHVVINMDMPKEIEAYTHRIGKGGNDVTCDLSFICQVVLVVRARKDWPSPLSQRKTASCSTILKTCWSQQTILFPWRFKTTPLQSRSLQLLECYSTLTHSRHFHSTYTSLVCEEPPGNELIIRGLRSTISCFVKARSALMFFVNMSSANSIAFMYSCNSD